ncbi:ankyrin repeat-containing protein, putative [Entamoeba invadens IP1]|uniref:Ankyrin repeat-containing protein, putative n=1 Tax=Entamoeba invadens IP1 TaxID=370355 RepID=A0A0A1UE15_ENTIV|nr:ankyrin repeat-containing protein, putative [Entamoeba invadens IP1]ELP94840.1 ankyrin repeat-containing protein, putative [Entamoeba invadens IP1]|eukprot:XP_004261611.1 ankyrin repeat-containing protein, putative [Entamoeba invadens IP1]
MATSSLDLFQRVFIGDDGYNLMIEISRGVSIDSLDFVQDCITFYEAHKQTLHFLTFLIHSELLTTTNGTMFRGNSFCSRCLMTYTTMTSANQYVTSFLKDPMQKVLSGQFGALELNPDYATQPLDKTADLLKQIVAAFIDAFIDSAELWPETYRYLCYVLFTEAEQAHLKPLQCVGGFLILRLICPAIMQPNKSGFCQEKPSEEITRGLVTICKMIQNIANDTVPHEPHLRCLEEFLEDQSLKLAIALTGISSVRPTKFSFLSFSDKELDKSINGIITMWKNNIKNVDSYLQEKSSEEYKELARAVLKYNTKSYFKRKSIMKKKKKEEIAISTLFALSKNSNGSVSEMQTVLKKYPEVIDCTDVDMMTPLQYACVMKNVPIAIFLIKNGASLFLRDSMGCTALHYACMSNLTDVLKEMREADFLSVGEIDELGNTCLHYLAKHEFRPFHIDFLQYLVSKDSAILSIANFNGDIPLHVAVETALKDHEMGPSTISALVKFGSNFETPNLKKQTPLGRVQDKGRSDLEILMMSQDVIKVAEFVPLPSTAETRMRSNSCEKKGKKRTSILLHRSPASPRLLAAYQNRTSFTKSSSPLLGQAK